ncbi:MAG TPA: HDOD domain-containing protein [Deltaproteobacteria bacterium]|nr:HDOD domain-containing protein [Deltaproteobacteria bacterium]HPJ92408.1 HDOD domain-containing protein [Deltaproteobacteria bacterium]HPR50407.1 HDOD domain-containing protein [Deltaproteobacteria bacterium]
MKKYAPEEIESLLNNLGDIPTLPSIATTIMEKTLDAKVNARQIAQMVEKDQGLAIKVLKVANSPFYRRIKEISTIRGAVVLLGFNVLKSIVLSISVINLFNEKEKRVLDFYKFWQHSIACAVCAKSIANKVLPSFAEDAFIAGLLHDLGKVVSDQLICTKGEYAQVLDVMDRANSDIIKVEQNIVGIDHATLGRYLMEKWNLPSLLSKTIAFHHSINEIIDDDSTKKLCSIIHVADIITNHLGLGLSQAHGGFVDPALLKQLELSSQDIQDISITLKDNISDISEEMGIPKAEPKTYFEVLQFANAQLGKLSLDLEQKKMALERRTVELSSLNLMSSQLQSSMKLSDITNIITTNSLTILDSKKTRCLMRLNNLRVMVTESFWLSSSAQTRTGMATATKELLERTNGVYPKSLNVLYAPLKVDGKTIGVIEALPQEHASPDEINQKTLLLRTIAEVGAQAIQRAMLMTRNIKSQRLAAVSKTAIAANHEINSPLTTILLKLDMLINEGSLSKGVVDGLTEVKNEAIKIKTVVKKMLEISDVVETNYVKNEKMIDIHNAPKQKIPEHTAVVDEAPAKEEFGGFEDYLEQSPQAKPQPNPAAKTQVSYNSTPGFEDYLDQQHQEMQKSTSASSTCQQVSPGFEDYLEE